MFSCMKRNHSSHLHAQTGLKNVVLCLPGLFYTCRVQWFYKETLGLFKEKLLILCCSSSAGTRLKGVILKADLIYMQREQYCGCGAWKTSQAFSFLDLQNRVPAAKGGV